MMVALFLSVACGHAAAAATLQITEFMAINDETTIDDDDDRSDWIEIHNPTGVAVNLGGWHLTDDFAVPDKWTFPDVALPPSGYMVVFASSKDRRTPGAPLHTNFNLRGSGDYLALIDPEGNRVSEFLPTYPEQRPDISYGLGRDAAQETILVDTGAPARALIPEDDSLGTTWREVEFDASSWLSGTTGVGYDYGGLIGLDVGDMRYENETVYIRIPFQIDELPAFDSLSLRIQYEDGMIAYLNGQRLAGENDPENPTWDSGALANRPDSEATSFVDIDVSSALDLLREGENVLAFHGLNYLLTSSDLLVRPQLVAAIYPQGPEVWGYSLLPTPGLPNGPTVPGVTDKVGFSVPSRSFTNSVVLELTLPDDAPEGSVIRYTEDGSLPTESSPLYSGELTITTTTQVRARVFGPNGEQSPTASETYLGLETDVVNFSSNLPLIVLENFGAGWMSQSTYQPVFMGIFDRGTYRSSLTNAPDLSTRAGIKIRGSSTAGRPKPSLAVEAWDEFNEDKNISPLGMPRESDWVLWGPYNFDRALMRNPLIYELSNQVGRYAVRTRFVEVFLNTGGGRLTYSDYWGVYALMEKISRDEDRVDVERLFPEHDRGAGVTGGYMLKIDRPDPGDSGFGAAGQTLLYVYPKEIDIERPERDAQEQYIRGFFHDFGDALNSSNYTDPYYGYPNYIDVDSWHDHHLLNVVAFNVDAFRLSGYMFKKRSRKLEMGPIWDFDRAMGSTDGRDINPWVWCSTGGTDFFNYPWWGRMFGDIDFFQKYIDRYQQLKRDSFSVANIHSVIDSMADELREAQVRDLARWGQTPRFGGYQGEIDHIKQWFADRIAFMDSQFVSPPTFSSNGGQITPGLTLTMTAPKGTIYYTLDGTDPRLPGGGVAGGAFAYTSPLPLTDTVEVVARVHNPNHTSLTGSGNPPLSSKWSGPMKARFSIHPLAASGNIAMTEFHYHPLDPTEEELAVNPDFTDEDFEFIELKNIGSTTIDIVGVQFTNGIQFSFTKGGMTTLDPGEFALLVRNRTAFQVRYGAFENIAGQYTGSLSNGGENLSLNNASDETIAAFAYDDDWHLITDGAGFSLVAVNEHAAPGEWGSRDSWRASAEVGGSPGRDDPRPPGISPIVVNEALTNTDAPEVDVIELYNPTKSDTDIGGWFLTDDSATPKKFRIPDGTVIPAGGYLLFDENDFNRLDLPKPSRFALSSAGEEVFLFSADGEGTLTGYLHGFFFGPAEIGTTFGRHVISTGDDHFVAQVSRTLNGINAGPKVGPIVINEIMYNPPLIGGQDNTDHEFLELINVSSEPVTLCHPESPAYTWRIEGGVSYVFPEGVTLLPGEFLLLVSFDPEADLWSLAAFLDTYGAEMSATVLGPYVGNLPNSGGAIRLCRPDETTTPTESDDETFPYILTDQVNYSSEAPWPEGASSTGQSLQRQVSGAYGNDPLNWQVAEPTAGTDNAEAGNLDADEDGLPNDWESAHGLDPLVATEDDGAAGDPDGDDSTNLREYLSGTHPRDATSFFAVHSINSNAASVLLTFSAVAGRTYSVLYCDALGSGEWLKLEDVPVQMETGVVEIHDPEAETVGTRFYRVVTPQMP